MGGNGHFPPTCNSFRVHWIPTPSTPFDPAATSRGRPLKQRQRLARLRGAGYVNPLLFLAGAAKLRDIMTSRNVEGGARHTSHMYAYTRMSCVCLPRRTTLQLCLRDHT